MIEWIRGDLSEVRKAGSAHGIELRFAMLLVGLRLFSISYWLKYNFPDPCLGARRARNNITEWYCFVQLVVLLICIGYSDMGNAGCAIGAYVLLDIYLNLFNIVFIGKFRNINAPPASIERSLLFLLLNVTEVVLAFTLFYRHWMQLPTDCAFYGAVLVMGTVGTPPLSNTGDGRLLIILQIFLDLLLIVLFLSSFAAQIGLFQSRDRNQPEKDSDA